LKELTKNPLFEECGYQIIGSSTDPIAAKKEIKKLSPDVVFTDLRMPGLSGVELVETLKEDGALCEFVIISAYEEFKSLQRFLRSNGFDYLIKPVSDEDLQSLLGSLAVSIAGKKQHSMTGAETLSPELNKITDYLKENMMSKHTLASVSEALNMHSKHISRLFTNYLGTTFVAYLTKLRMEEAAGLLRGTMKEISEISALCGFPDYFYFCRVFREYHFCTPKAFREGARK
jgi:YesN/AraC family two-component response regulator